MQTLRFNVICFGQNPPSINSTNEIEVESYKLPMAQIPFDEKERLIHHLNGVWYKFYPKGAPSASASKWIDASASANVKVKAPYKKAIMSMIRRCADVSDSGYIGVWFSSSDTMNEHIKGTINRGSFEKLLMIEKIKCDYLYIVRCLKK